MPRFARRPKPDPQTTPPRLLFLDDDPGRAEVFLAEHPNAVWVQTAAECIARLEEPWDEVHLDHDLGGEHFVDHDREDCGMEVVRWLCFHDRPHLKTTRFQVHSHNPVAASMMGMQMMVNGYTVVVRPFGALKSESMDWPEPPSRHSLYESVRQWLRRLLRLEDYEYPAAREALPRPDQLPLEPFDIHWMRTPASTDAGTGELSPEGPPEPPSSL